MENRWVIFSSDLQFNFTGADKHFMFFLQGSSHFNSVMNFDLENGIHFFLFSKVPRPLILLFLWVLSEESKNSHGRSC
jgi:hypothetical protein